MNHTNKALISIAIMLLILTLFIDAGIERLQNDINQRQQEIYEMRDSLEETKEYVKELREFVDKLTVLEVEASAYAPLDPAAKEGMCYSGSPYETATGAITTPGRTIAVDPDVIPYGAKVWIPGVGVRIAEDTGGMIEGAKVDLCVETQKEAYAIGRRQAVAVWMR